MLAFLRTFALAGLVCLATAGRNLAWLRAVKDEAREFDYFMFVRQWPGQYCSTHSCPLIHNRGYHFTIHGLWPNYEDGTWPQFCDADYAFDETKLEDLRKALEEEWPSAFNSYESFWEHEWSKHGTCALSVFRSEHRYFQDILKLHARYDLAAALRRADIVPREGVKYRREELEDAIYDMYGARPLVHCYGGELSEIWMCFGKDLRPFECDTGHALNQCEELTIPPLVAEAEDDLSDVATGKRLAVQRIAAEGLSVVAQEITDDADTLTEEAEQGQQQQQGEDSGDLLAVADTGATAAGREAEPAAGSDVGGADGRGPAVDSTTSAQISGAAAMLASLDAARLEAAAKVLRAELLRDSGEEALPGRATAAAVAASAAAAGASGAGPLLGLDWGRFGGAAADGAVRLLDDVYDGNAADDSVFSVLEAKRHDDVAMGFLSEEEGEAEQKAGAGGQKATAAGTVIGGGPDMGSVPGSSTSGDQVAADGSSGRSGSGVSGDVYMDWLPHDALPYATAQLRGPQNGRLEQGAAQDGEGLGWQPALTGAVNAILQEILAGLGLTDEREGTGAVAAVRQSTQTSPDVSQVVQLASAAGAQWQEQEEEGKGQLQGRQGPAAESSAIVAQTAATLLQQLIADLAGDSAAREASAAERGQQPYDAQPYDVQEPSSSGRLTQSENAFTAAEDEAEGLLSSADAVAVGFADAAAVTVVSEDNGVGGDSAAAAGGGANGFTMWDVPGVGVVQQQQQQQQPDASGFSASRSLLPGWVIALVIAQLVGVGMIALSLAMMAGMAIAGAWHGSREAEQQEELPFTVKELPPVAQRPRWWGRQWTVPSAAVGLAEPLLYDEADGKADGDGNYGDSARGNAGWREDLVSGGGYGEPYGSVLVPCQHAHGVQGTTTTDEGVEQDGCGYWSAVQTGVMGVPLQVWEPEQQELRQWQEQYQQQQQRLQPTASGAVRQQVSCYAPVV